MKASLSSKPPSYTKYSVLWGADVPSGGGGNGPRMQGRTLFLSPAAAQPAAYSEE